MGTTLEGNAEARIAANQRRLHKALDPRGKRWNNVAFLRSSNRSTDQAGEEGRHA